MFERSIDGDEERRTFVLGEENIDILNSTELRSPGFFMDLLPRPPLSRQHLEEEHIWLLPRTVEAKALVNCR
jgi:hypothetical protein